MSMSYEEAAYDQYMSDLYEEHKKEAITEFKYERLCSYYENNKMLAKPAFESLYEARKLNEINPTGGLIFSSIAIEVGIKTILLKPIVCGLVNTESVVSLIIDMVFSHQSMDKYRELLFGLMRLHGGIDLTTLKIQGSNKNFWNEIKDIQKIRNDIIHKAEKASKNNANLALSIASEILEKIFPEVMNKMGFHLHENYKICSELKCKP